MEPGARPAAAGGADGRGTGAVVQRRALLGRLAGPARVTVVCAPAGSGKTVLLRSWARQPGMARRVAWVAAVPGEQDPQRFWLSVTGALAQTGPGSALVRAVSAAPDLDGWAMAEHLLTDLTPLAEPVWLVIDDAHELGPGAERQLALLVLRAPPLLRFVLASRQQVRLGLHRLRLEGELSEISPADLRFSLAETRELFSAARVDLPAGTAELLLERTEGWAAGLRLAALAMAGNPAPGRFAAEFSGSERTVAEYLLAEVLERQGEQVRQLLLRTSVLERVNGELADLLAGGSGGERVLQDLEFRNAFVTAVDAGRSWFRYHQMFAGFLRLELRRTWPEEVTGLHQAAAHWHARRGDPVQATRHALEAGDFDLAAGLLAEHWPGLHLDGRDAAVRELLAGFPPALIAADAGLAAVAAADELAYGSAAGAERYLSVAGHAPAAGTGPRQAQARLLAGIGRLLLAGQRGDLDSVAAQAAALQSLEQAQDAAAPHLGQDLRALALVTRGAAEHWTGSFAAAGQHLDQGVALARQIGRPYLEFTGLAYQASAEVFHSFGAARELGRQAAGLAGQHGWSSTPAAGMASIALGTVSAWEGKLDEAELWCKRAALAVRAGAPPGAGLAVCYLRGLLALARGQDAAALAAFRAGAQLARQLTGPGMPALTMRFFVVQALVRLGRVQEAEQVLAGFGGDRERGETRIAGAMCALAAGDPRAAAAALAPVVAGTAALLWRDWRIQAFLLEAIARDRMADPGGAGRALQRALAAAEHSGVLLWFALHPVPGLLERHAGRGGARSAVVTAIGGLLAGTGLPGGRAGLQALPEPLSAAELRLLRYLPTSLTAPEIARELSVSHNTIRTHMRNVYAKLGTHRRSDTVSRARALGLLAPAAGAVSRPRR